MHRDITVYSNSIPRFVSTTGCSNDCFDYNRSCPAVKNQTFYDEYKQLHEDGELGLFNNAEILPEPACNDSFYQYACPRSCGKCWLVESYFPNSENLHQKEQDVIAFLIQLWYTGCESSPLTTLDEFQFLFCRRLFRYVRYVFRLEDFNALLQINHKREKGILPSEYST